MKITGAGATFPYPQIAHWVKLFQSVSGVEITYQSVGSGAGQRMFLSDRVVDFGCSDPPLTKSQYEQFKDQVMQIPWLMGAVVVVYNVPEIPGGYSLRLSGEVIARIFKGEIEYWDDKSIKELNPEVADKLPHQPIIAVHRSDSSGTTEVFTTYLHKSSPQVWPKELVGKQVNWPVDQTGRGVGGKGNEGVTAVVVQTRYSIGYVEWSYAIENKLSMAAVKNAAGKYVLPSHTSIASAARITLPASPLDDFSHTFAEVIHPPNEDAYPISSFTYIFVRRSYDDRLKALAISEFLKWVVYEGYKNVIPGYVAPPEQVVSLLLQAASILEK
ncbi:MAG: phosphate ABC transporter substrate-binding protein PstS [Ignisphaera sp.]|nr:phosphate ABC transporter substrate-binding protein PstS [Ignisphaera sp.]MDW8085842.1 phosphate ABC transporter substrate-binding protein PstS [Ignisphaera sp.]